MRSRRSPSSATEASASRTSLLPSRTTRAFGGGSRAASYAAAMPNDKPEPLTQAQKAQLEAELEELEGPRRADMVQAIATARGFGDLSENFEYHAAKNEQGLLERRITILRDRLAHAEIVADGRSHVVSIGSHVVVEDEAGERIDFELSALGGAGTVSPSSPLGSALLGRQVGDAVDVQAPSGPWRATIIVVRA